MDHQDLFNNLMIMAAADGKLAKEEIALLVDRAREWGISRGEVAATMEFAASSDAEFVLPSSSEEGRQVLEDLARVMAADGELADVERKLFALAAAAMDITTDDLNRIFDRLTQSE